MVTVSLDSTATASHERRNQSVTSRRYRGGLTRSPFGNMLSAFGKALIFLQTENSRVVLQHNGVEDHPSILERVVARGAPKWSVIVLRPLQKATVVPEVA